MTHKVIGQARAKQRGYYPTADGPCVLVEEGTVFDVIESQPKAAWFDVIELEKPKPTGKKPAAEALV